MNVVITQVMTKCEIQGIRMLKGAKLYIIFHYVDDTSLSLLGGGGGDMWI
jgi:hypothetical protein